jgi:hypothetical protein
MVPLVEMVLPPEDFTLSEYAARTPASMFKRRLFMSPQLVVEEVNVPVQVDRVGEVPTTLVIEVISSYAWLTSTALT